MSDEPHLQPVRHLFEAFGVELEYMLVSDSSLDVMPIADQVLTQACGSLQNEVERGPLAWSNELALHVIELKTNGPVSSLDGLASRFASDCGIINSIMAPLGGRMMPGAMHPWMNPHQETKLWPHGNRTIYEAYDRIFSCQGHGWSNVQSAHLNIGFHGDEEFGRLHAAIRLLLPILPALAASSPVVEDRLSGVMDTRLAYYRNNQKRVPAVAGRIIPEAVWTEQDYRDQILARTYRDIAPFDPDGLLQDEWLNSRGAIARFQRSAIEIRLLDVQECPKADLAICGFIIAAIRVLVDEQLSSFAVQSAWHEDPLRAILDRCIQDADLAVIDNADYLAVFGITDPHVTAMDIWRHLARCALPSVFLPIDCEQALENILTHGPLARRLLASLGPDPDRARLTTVYGRLCACLRDNVQFLP